MRRKLTVVGSFATTNTSFRFTRTLLLVVCGYRTTALGSPEAEVV